MVVAEQMTYAVRSKIEKFVLYAVAVFFRLFLGALYADCNTADKELSLNPQIPSPPSRKWSTRGAADT